MTLEKLHSKIEELYTEYKDDETIILKLNQYIISDLPTQLINTKKSQKLREDRRASLQESHDKFVSQFINKNIYFYCITSEIFFIYDGHHYSIIKEDTLIHNILSTVRHRDNEHQILESDTQLLPWKFKTKTSIVKQIRETSVFTSIPESATIQEILDIFTLVFESKSQSKYFLTIIGDTVLKKSTCINIISPAAKSLIRILENIGSQYFGHIPLLQAFRFKYHDHNYNDCRILNIRNKIEESVLERLNKIIIDIFVVASYYSTRYNNADEYLETCEDQEFIERTLFLKNNTQETIVNKFISSKIQNSNNYSISMRNMLYLWKVYLDEIKLPNIIFTTTLKQLLKKQLNYNEDTDCFNDCTSLSIPLVSNFINFWDEHIKDDIGEYYLEIDEICTLFKQHIGKGTNINENTITNLIRHFYPDTTIDNKYIYAISCDLWNKQDDIINYINMRISDQTANAQITLYELYMDYSTRYCKKYKKLIVISKPYFDLFVNNLLKDSDTNTELQSQLQLT